MRERRFLHTIPWMQQLFIAFFYLLYLASILTPGYASAHGGVVLEDDLCVINVGFYQAHFTIFQPINTQHEQFCEDLPGTGESVFVLEYLHDGLEQLPVDFRIIRNVTGMGLFAGVNDVEALGDLDVVTEFYHPPVTEPDAFAVLHEFAEPGAFIGIVTAVHPDTDTLYTAVFPFEVGAFGLNYPLIAVGVVLGLLAVLAVSSRWRSGGATVATLCAGLLLPMTADAAEIEDVVSADGYYRVTAISRIHPLAINQMHAWELQVFDRSGQPVINANISVSGGMPAHDHGLPTDPRITRELGEGRYLLEGVKFHMRGAWELYVLIDATGRPDTATLSLEL